MGRSCGSTIKDTDRMIRCIRNNEGWHHPSYFNFLYYNKCQVRGDLVLGCRW